MTKREGMIKALDREKIVGLVPHFELVFFLTMEKFGLIHPSHQVFTQWNQMSPRERELHIRAIARAYIAPAEYYGHGAIFVQSDPAAFEFNSLILEEIRRQSGREYMLMLHGDNTYSIPNGDNMVDFSVQMYEEPDYLKSETDRRTDAILELALKYKNRGNGELLDCFALCSDYSFNTNPFFPPDIFAEISLPYLKRLIKELRGMGYYTIKHSDGNINPLMDMLAECNPHAIHSIDPQGHMNLAEMKRKYSDKVCLIGNVNCGLLQTGTEEEVIADVRRSLREGMTGYGYIFSTSNCIYTGLPLERYELMHKIWMKEGIYQDNK